MINRIQIVIFFILIGVCFSPVRGQDSRIGEGEEAKVKLGAEARNGKLTFSSADGNFMWWFDLRLQLDAAMYFENENLLANGSQIRRADLSIKGTLYRNWQAELDK